MEMFFAYYLWTIMNVAILLYTHNYSFDISLIEWVVFLVASVIPGINILIVLGFLVGFAIDRT